MTRSLSRKGIILVGVALVAAILGVTVLASLHPLPGLAFVAGSPVQESDGWFRQLAALGAVGSVVLLLGLLASALRRLESSQRSLTARNAELETARRQFDAVLSNMSQGLCFFSGDQRLIVCNQRYAEVYHLPPEAIRPGMLLSEIVDLRFAAGSFPDTTRAGYLASRDVVARHGGPHDSVIDLRNGRTIAIHHRPMPDGGWVATHEDITERRATEASLAFIARHDVLTGLANRALLQERLERAFAAAGRGGAFAVLFLDLDRFKAVNDTLGHQVGDELLRAVAARLLACVREVDTVARLGGDEFVILQDSLHMPEDAAHLAERILTAFRQPYLVAGHELVAGTSIGVAVAPDDGTTAETLLKNADLALYMAKGEGRGTFRFFEPEMDARVQNRHALERDLRNAIAQGEFTLHYQPIVDLQSGRVRAFEALLRWNHPVNGLISPADFIPVAEECGLIMAIGEWVLEHACRQAAGWPDGIHVAVNLSPVQFRFANLTQVVTDALTGSGLPGGRLEVEITESVLLQRTETALATLNELRRLGVRIAMDDFGSGYSSLSYLRHFRFDKIKIDQSFIKDITTQDDARFIVRAIVGLCRGLGIRTTVEGVETSEQLAILLGEGCTDAQGYLFGRPMPADQLGPLLSGRPLLIPRSGDPGGGQTGGDLLTVAI